MPNNKMILLNPGPVNLSDRVRNALLPPDLCHREVEFSQLQSRIREQLLQVYGLGSARWAAVLLTGSGTAAMEAMISSLVPSDGKLLVIENGVYGERLELAPICQERHIKLLVDEVSSFGAEGLNFADWGITACAATANKCLHGVPGVSFVILQRDALPSVYTIPRTLYPPSVTLRR